MEKSDALLEHIINSLQSIVAKIGCVPEEEANYVKAALQERDSTKLLPLSIYIDHCLAERSYLPLKTGIKELKEYDLRVQCKLYN